MIAETGPRGDARGGPPPLWFYRGLLRVRPAILASWLKRLLRVRRRAVRTPRGRFFVDPASNLGYTLLHSGEYEPEMLKVLETFLGPGGTFVDVGANEGYFAMVAAGLVGPGGRVVAVEPQARLHPVLRRNVELHGAANVVLARAAITDRPGTARLFMAPDTNTGSSGLTRTTRYGLATETVETLTLAELFDRHGVDRADLLKIDIEGSEYEAVLGAPELFQARRVRAVALELHPHFLARRGLSAEPILAELHRAGYTPDARFHPPDTSGAANPLQQYLVLTAPERG